MAEDLVLITTIINVALSVANAALLVIHLFLENRRTKESLQLSRRDQRIRIIETSELRVELLEKNNEEQIKVTNVGEREIDKLSLNIIVMKFGVNLLDKEYPSKSLLQKSREFYVPLHKILRKVLEGRKLMSYREDEVGFEFDPDVGHEVPKVIGKWWAKEDFSLEIALKTRYEAVGEEKIQRDTFRADYRVDSEFYRDQWVFIDSDNFELQIQRVYVDGDEGTAQK